MTLIPSPGSFFVWDDFMIGLGLSSEISLVLLGFDLGFNFGEEALDKTFFLGFLRLGFIRLVFFIVFFIPEVF